MKRTILIALIGVMFAGCSTYTPYHTYVPSPCNDPLFISLKSKPLDSLSAREYDYYKTKSGECERYDATQKAQQKLDDTMSNYSSTYIAIIVIGALATAAILLIH